MTEKEDALPWADYQFLNPEKAWYNVPIHCSRCGKAEEHLVVPYAISEEEDWWNFLSLLRNLLEKSFTEVRVITSFRDAPVWVGGRIVANRSLANEYGEIMIARCKTCETKRLYVPSQEIPNLYEYDQYFWRQHVVINCKVCGGDLYQFGDRDTVGYCRNEPANYNGRCIGCGGRWLDASGGYSGPNLQPNYLVCRDCEKRMYNGRRSPKYWQKKEI